MVEQWRIVFRASAPLLPRAGLLALREALAADDPTLLQGATTSPPPLECIGYWPCEGACPWGFCYWKASNEVLGVLQVEHWFGEFCTAVDEAAGEYTACRHFTCWVDDTPREEMRAALLPEVDR